MSKYEFSLQQEVLLETGASILGDLFRYERYNQVPTSSPISAMYDFIWSAKQDILLAKTEYDLAQIEGQFALAKKLLHHVEVDFNAN